MSPRHGNTGTITNENTVRNTGMGVDMAAQERLKMLVDAINSYVAAGNDDVPEGKIRAEYTRVMQKAHALAFEAVDVSTRISDEMDKLVESSSFENTEKVPAPLKRFASVQGAVLKFQSKCISHLG